MLRHDQGEPRAALLEVIRQVRHRWRMKLAIRGAVGFIAATVLALVASAYALEALRFSPGAILSFRIILFVVAGALAAWFLVRPLMRKVSDDQVALYLEEHEPTLEATIITAMRSRPWRSVPNGCSIEGARLAGTDNGAVIDTSQTRRPIPAKRRRRTRRLAPTMTCRLRRRYLSIGASLGGRVAGLQGRKGMNPNLLPPRHLRYPRWYVIRGSSSG